ncbi:MAG: hypothetical protein NT066_06960 [Candidatus Omnitrophica bacterium]|nr:hypothetical protein [Candidatus Omnitrophota bacterium]
MASLTLSIPTELKRKMAEFKYINWSEVARHSILNKLQLLEKMDRLLSKSSLTEEDTIKYGSLINKRIWKRHKAS